MRLRLNKHEPALPGSIITANGRTWLSQIDLTRNNTIITIEGKLVKVEPVLEPGVGMTLQLLVYTGKKEIQRVYLGHSWYIASAGKDVLKPAMRLP